MRKPLAHKENAAVLLIVQEPCRLLGAVSTGTDGMRSAAHTAHSRAPSPAFVPTFVLHPPAPAQSGAVASAPWQPEHAGPCRCPRSLITHASRTDSSRAGGQRRSRSSAPKPGLLAKLKDKAAPSKPKSAPQQQQDDEVAVPEVGWLWSVGDSAPASSPTRVSAQATVTDLRKDRISAKKSLGQNFLTDDEILQDIVRAAGVKPGDLVLEIGPGTGNLTKHLIQAGAHVTAVEKDDVLYARLAETYAQEPRLTLIHEDVLKLKLDHVLSDMCDRAAGKAPINTQPDSLTAPQSDSQTPQPSMQAVPEPAVQIQGAQQASAPGLGQAGAADTATATAARSAATASATASQVTLNQGSSKQTTEATVGVSAQQARRVKVVANLPYNITTDFLKAALPQGDSVSDLHIMLQEEAGVRLVKSRPGDSDWRAMSLRVALYSKPQYRFRISKTKYYPQPGVDGALITFKLLPRAQRPPLFNETDFLRTLDRAFGQRRKMIKNSLQPAYTAEEVEVALQKAGVGVTARAQDLTLAQWLTVYNTLKKRAGDV